MVGNAPHLVELVEHLLCEGHVAADANPAHAAHHLVLGLLVGRGATPPVRYLDKWNVVSEFV